MERYFILVMIVTLGAVTTPKTNGSETNSRAIQQKEKTITTWQRSAEYSGVLTSYTKIKTSAAVVHEQRIYSATSCRNSAPIHIKNWLNQKCPAAQIQESGRIFCASNYG
jgi:hypothetical protein